MSDFFKKWKKILALDDSFDEDDLVDEESIEENDDIDQAYDERKGEKEQINTSLKYTGTPTGTPNLRVISQPARMDLLNLEMRDYNMTDDIAEYIKNRKPIIVNMKQLQPSEIQRAVDFLSGACLVLNGNVEKITEAIYLFAPENVNINQAISSAQTNFSRNDYK